MDSPPWASPRDWEGLWNRAAAATAGTPPFEAVYPGPAWPVSSGAKSGERRVWKIAVVERRAGGGADHWGHLFIAVAENATAVDIRPEGGMQGDADRPHIESLPSLPGIPLQIWIRPRSADTLERLRTFAVSFRGHAVTLVTA